MIDKKRPYSDYDELMAAVHEHCLAEYERRWGRPWDGSLRKTKEHVIAMLEAAKRGQQVWKKLCDAMKETMKETIGFVAEHGLDITKRAELLELVGCVPYEAIAFHGSLRRNQRAIVWLLELQFDPILSIRSEFATGLELQRLEEPATPGTIRWNYDGRPLGEEEMAIGSLLSGIESSRIKKKLRNEALSIVDVITMEREAINAALHRHGESKCVAKERPVQAIARSGKRADGRTRPWS